MKRTVLPLLLGITVLVACGPSTRGDDDDFGGDGGHGGSGGSGGSGDDGCSAASKLIYTVDQHNELYQFDATTKAFTTLGTLNCPGTGSDPNNPFSSDFEPFSMGVDRNANAYVLYVDQVLGSPSKIFKVDTNTAGLPCTATTFTAPTNLQEFGMGFSTTTMGGDQDQLFIAGGTAVATTSPADLNTLDVTSMAVSHLGTVTGSPELTGNANAELWGFFPDASNPRIEQINKATGASITPAMLPATMKGMPMAWAFAFYGGDYFVFLMKDSESSTTVYEVSPAGMIVTTTPAPGKVIVGAGVSTCAPVVIE
jgi:hypothetical protein